MIGVISRRNWALRLSLVLNVCVFLYVCAHFGSSSGPWIEETPTNWGETHVQPESVFRNGIATDRKPNGTKIISSSSSSVVSGSSSLSLSSSFPPSSAPNLKDLEKSTLEKKSEAVKEETDKNLSETDKNKKNQTVIRYIERILFSYKKKV